MKLPKLKNWYHATTLDNAKKILAAGYLIPQEHRTGGLTLGVFFANTKSNAGIWMAQRGHKEYVVFTVPRNRFDTDQMFIGGADRMPQEINMICMRYQGIVPVSTKDVIPVRDDRNFDIPGWKKVQVGTGKFGYECVDPIAFESYVNDNPELKAMIEKRIELAVE